MSEAGPSAESEIEALLPGLLDRVRAEGLRRSPTLIALLLEMARDDRPRTLASLAEIPTLAGRDPVTIYRVIMKLEGAGMVRRLSLGSRAHHFQLIRPGRQPDYLICTDCGSLQEITEAAFLVRVEEDVAARSGWSSVRHELEFFGVCPNCAEPESALAAS